MRGEREGNIERVAARSGRPLFLSVTSPGEGRIVTRGARHAQHRLLNFRGYAARDKLALRAPVSPRAHGMSPERAASALRVAFALQVLLAARSDVPCPTFVSSWEAAALLVPPSRHSWLHGYLLLLAPRRPRL